MLPRWARLPVLASTWICRGRQWLTTWVLRVCWSTRNTHKTAVARSSCRRFGALSACTLDLRRLAWDLSLFTTQEFGFVKLPAQYCTGSSIMPNKNNPDTVELLRAVHGVVQGAQAELAAVLCLPSGYQRDLQATKPPLLRAFEKGLQALALLPGLLAGFEWQVETDALCSDQGNAGDRSRHGHGARRNAVPRGLQGRCDG